jgi:hypothetical protein
LPMSDRQSGLHNHFIDRWSRLSFFLDIQLLIPGLMGHCCSLTNVAQVGSCDKSVWTGACCKSAVFTQKLAWAWFSQIYIYIFLDLSFENPTLVLEGGGTLGLSMRVFEWERHRGEPIGKKAQPPSLSAHLAYNIMEPFQTLKSGRLQVRYQPD